jgi:hypothetical protein
MRHIFSQLWYIVPRKIWQPCRTVMEADIKGVALLTCETSFGNFSNKKSTVPPSTLGLHGREVSMLVANSTIMSYIASAVKIYNASGVNFYNATGCLARFENKNILFYFEKKHSSLLQRRRCSCQFRSRRVGLAPGVDFMNLHLCRKFFGTNLIPLLWQQTKIWPTITTVSVGFNGSKM